MQDLFADTGANQLPCDGEVYYWGGIFSPAEAEQWLQTLLLQIPWQADRAHIYGRHIITQRQYAWFADRPYEYRYSGILRQAKPWPAIVNKLRQRVEAKTAKPYNACLLNYYPDGAAGMAWHADNEPELLADGSIASLSFGVPRKFAFKHIEQPHKLAFELGRGDLLEMCGATQRFWLHCVPKSKLINAPRVNLTFRQMLA
ncbi:MAG: alpha-ketoglutarate-dependent dioxygenase AlkB [Cellvibrionaceae bacterium]|nr:alpha-ketoglutarate-dependent dioxygenase AlkB [Cellvibrionaceae bacterium]MCV6624577.1 alpha-ketoglutarate-dependent dioxygenase AlkB [Cellvibrionaceae bacterium]